MAGFLANGYAQVARTPGIVQNAAAFPALPVQQPVVGLGGVGGAAAPYRPAIPRPAVGINRLRTVTQGGSFNIGGSWSTTGSLWSIGRYIGFLFQKIAGLEIFGIAALIALFRHGPRDRIRAIELLPLAGIWWLLRALKRDVWEYQAALFTAARNMATAVSTQISNTIFDPLAGMEAAANAAAVAAANSAANVYGEWGGLNPTGIAAGSAAGATSAAVAEAVSGIEGPGAFGGGANVFGSTVMGAAATMGPTIGVGGPTGMGPSIVGGGIGASFLNNAASFAGPIACSPWGYSADTLLTVLLVVALVWSTLTARTRTLGVGWAGFLAFVIGGVAVWFLGQCAGVDSFGIFQWTGGSVTSAAYQAALDAQAQAAAATQTAVVDNNVLRGIGEGVGPDFGIFERNDPLPMDNTPVYLAAADNGIAGMYYSPGPQWWLFVLYLIAYARPHSSLSSTVEWLRVHWAWLALVAIAAILTPSQVWLAQVLIALRVAYIVVAPQGAYSEPLCVTAWIRRRNQYERALNIADARSGSCQPSRIRSPTTRCQPYIEAATPAYQIADIVSSSSSSSSNVVLQSGRQAVVVAPSSGTTAVVAPSTRSVVRSRPQTQLAVAASPSALLHPVNVPTPCLPCPSAASAVLASGGSATAALIAGGAPGMRGVAINATGKAGVTLHGGSAPGVVMPTFGVLRRVTLSNNGM